ncbi:uncharacterized [Lates japonicus]
MVDLSRKTMAGLRLVSNRVPATSDRPRGSAASRPRPAARCSPACRSSTSSRCSSCKCCTRNSSSLCYSTATVLVRMVVGIQGHRGIQRAQDIQTTMLELSPTINKTRLRLSRREAPLLPNRVTSSLPRLHHNRIPPSFNRVLLLQSLLHQSHRRTAAPPRLKRPTRRIHPRQKTTNPYLCRNNSSFGTNSIFRTYRS